VRASIIWLSAAGLALAACTSCSSSSGKGFAGSSSGGDSGSGSSSGGSNVSLMQACQDFAHATCTQANTCSPFTTAIAYGNETTCEARSLLACMPLVGPNGSSLTAGGIEQCAQAITPETCAEFLDNNQPSACNFQGTLGEGAPCGTGSQCSSGYCRLALGSTCGTCATRAGAGQAGPDGGAACVSDADCQANLLCAAGQCVAAAMSGMGCSATQPCLRTLACIATSADAGTGTCQTPVMVGGACINATDCDGATGAVCDTTKKMCVAAGQAMATQSCGIVNNQLVYCTGGSICGNFMKVDDAGLPVVGTCHQPAADGAKCGTGIGCTLPALCTSGAVCTLPNPVNCH
jgi:hypothetical protein